MSHVKINHHSSCDECRMNNVTHKMGSVLAIDCEKCIGNPAIRTYHELNKCGEAMLLEVLGLQSELMVDISRQVDGVDRGRLLKNMAWMECIFDRIKLMGGTFEKFELLKKDVILEMESDIER